MLLRGGFALDSLLDLTGCPTTSYDLTSLKGEEIIANDTLWENIINAQGAGALISASTSGEERWSVNEVANSQGELLPGHSYTIVQAREVYGQRLLNFRNVWAVFEWTGDWSPSSRLWNEQMVAALSPELIEDDGTFWMSYTDFLSYFHSVNICYVSSYYEARLRGKFVRVNVDLRTCVLSNVISRWYYCIDINSPTKLYIGVHQEDERFFDCYMRRPYLDIGIFILKREQGDIPTVFYYEESNIARQVETTVELPPGSYIILPRTSGCKLAAPVNPAQEYIALVANNRLNPIVESALKDIFKKFDITVTADLTYVELKALIESTGERFEPSDFEKLKKNYPFAQNGITLEGVFNYFRDSVLHRGEEKVRGWLNNLGYDSNLYSTKSKPFMLSIHCDKLLKVTVKDAIGTSIDKIAMLELLKIKGNKSNKQKSDVNLFVLQEPLAGSLTYGVFNDHQDKTVTPYLDLKELRGTITSPQANQISFTLPPKSGEIMVSILIVEENPSIKLNFLADLNST